MQLFVSPTSLFARLVRVIRLEKALTEEVSLEWVDPWASPDPLTRANPYSQVPALQLADGTTIVDSLVIASFLERRFPDIGWREPQPGLARWADELGQRPALIETRPPAG